MPLRESLTLTELLDLLNEAARQDPDAVLALMLTRVPCNELLSGHPTIQTGARSGGGFEVGPLGILNGLFGVDEMGWGAVTMVCDVEETADGKTFKPPVSFRRTAHA